MVAACSPREHSKNMSTSKTKHPTIRKQFPATKPLSQSSIFSDYLHRYTTWNHHDYVDGIVAPFSGPYECSEDGHGGAIPETMIPGSETII